LAILVRSRRLNAAEPRQQFQFSLVNLAPNPVACRSARKSPGVRPRLRSPVGMVSLRESRTDLSLSPTIPDKLLVAADEVIE
jgi:hypothetical protein